MTMESLQTSFPHPSAPSTKVHVLLDVCHMLKLLRNTFADEKILKASDGQILKLPYIEELHKLQQSEGLRLANKLKTAHMHGKNR